jgi:diaminopimelate epimerase
MRYSIFDPTGNITALVEDNVDVELQPMVAANIMKAHPKVEQVGFVTDSTTVGADTTLRMAGGEFCGNATMSAAALYALKHGCDDHMELHVRASGATDPVAVVLDKFDSDSFDARVLMPRAKRLVPVALGYRGLSDVVSVVFFEGISHVIIPESSVLYVLRHDASSAEEAVRMWCHELSADGLGLMFLSGNGRDRKLIPLVFVPGSDTVYWENSCASGSAAVGMFVGATTNAPCDLLLHEPGGTLRVSCNPLSAETWLFGHVTRVSTVQ